MKVATSVTPSLRELQQWMRWILTDPRGVASALESAPVTSPYPERYCSRARSCLAMVSDQAPLSAVARLDIYAEAYFIRIAESLGSDFAALKKDLGDEQFLRLAAAYLKAFPSRVGNIGEVGRHLPKFLRSRLSDGEYEGRPYLSDLARLEWAGIESFYAPDAAPLFPQALTQISTEDWPKVCFKLDPSVRLLGTRWSIEDHWQTRGNEDDKAPKIQALSAGSALLVHRRGGEVSIRRMEALEYRTLKSMASGEPLSMTCDRIARIASEPPPLMLWFQAWAHQEIIRSVRTGVIDAH